VTIGHARHRPPGRSLWAAAVTVVATAAVLVGITFGTGASDQDAPDAGVGSPPSPTSTSVAGDRRASHPEVTVRPMGRSAPTRLRIPAIGVNSSLMELGLQSDGSLEVPPDAVPAGWFTGSPTPGELGPAIIAGHVRWNGTPGVFEHLTDLQVDDVVDIARQDGSTAVFRVTRIEHFTKSAFPTEAVYGNIPHVGLRLITCGGLDPDTNAYEENVVVFAVLVS
jgi:sortase (surface protein transpeptidase)